MGPDRDRTRDCPNFRKVRKSLSKKIVNPDEMSLFAAKVLLLKFQCKKGLLKREANKNFSSISYMQTSGGKNTKSLNG